MLVPNLRGEHALKLFISTELKSHLETLSKRLERPVADVCRMLMWMGLPMLEGLDESRRRGIQLCTLWEEPNADPPSRRSGSKDARGSRTGS